LADACTKNFAELVQRAGPIRIDHLTFNASFKYSFINDPAIAVAITGQNQFEVYESEHGLVLPDGPAISEARLSDFLLGFTRVRKQYETVIRMRDAGVSAAWLLVSTYYCAYFACIELSKSMGRISLSLEEDELAGLKLKAAGPFFNQFFQSGSSNFVGIARAGKLVFSAVGTKPHSAAWNNALLVFRQSLGAKGWPDANHYIHLLSNDDCSPSRIRNAWNYRRSDYFGQPGEVRAREFRRLVGNQAGTTGWLARTAGRTEALDPCIVAVLAESLAFAVCDAGRRVSALVSGAAEA